MISFIAAIAACSDMKIAKGDDLINPNESFRFRSDAQRRATEKRALAGDIKSAQLLANYYSFVVQDDKQAIKWWRIAARNGDKEAYSAIKALQRR